MAVTAKPIIAWNNLLAASDQYAQSEEADSFPASNVKDLRPDTYWRSTTSGDQTIDFDMGAALSEAPDFFGILNSNFNTKTISISIQSDTVSNFASPTSVLGSTAFHDDDPQYNTSLNASTERYWRINITSIDSDYAQCAGFFIGYKYQFSRSPLDGWDPWRQLTDGLVNRTPKGHLVGSSSRHAQWIQQPQFTYLNTTDEAELERFYRDWGRLRKPFFFIPDENNYPTRIQYLVIDNPERFFRSEIDYRHWDMIASGPVLQSDL